MYDLVEKSASDHERFWINLVEIRNVLEMLYRSEILYTKCKVMFSATMLVV